MAGLADKQCVPCEKGADPLKGEEIRKLSKELTPKWYVAEEHHLEREFKFDDFRQALDFVNEVGELAEEQGHHPDIYLSYGKVKIQLWTHKINGLHENDFIMAAKIDALQPALASTQG
jgi:4a-hydroxytetrahydrobiopterin dehydratase